MLISISHKKVIDEIHALNAHFAISIWSSFGPMTKQFRELKEKKMLLNFKTWPETGYDTWPADPDYPSGVLPYDPYNPEARAIYWRYLNAGLFSKGIDGWWMDSTEPDHMQAKPSDYDNQTYLGSFRKVRNAYPLMSVGGVYTNQRAAASDKRVLHTYPLCFCRTAAIRSQYMVWRHKFILANSSPADTVRT